MLLTRRLFRDAQLVALERPTENFESTTSTVATIFRVAGHGGPRGIATPVCEFQCAAANLDSDTLLLGVFVISMPVPIPVSRQLSDDVVAGCGWLAAAELGYRQQVTFAARLQTMPAVRTSVTRRVGGATRGVAGRNPLRVKDHTIVRRENDDRRPGCGVEHSLFAALWRGLARLAARNNLCGKRIRDLQGRPQAAPADPAVRRPIWWSRCLINGWRRRLCTDAVAAPYCGA